MNRHNRYPEGWHGHHPKPETVTRWVAQREAREKIELQLYGFRRLFFRGRLPIKPA